MQEPDRNTPYGKVVYTADPGKAPNTQDWLKQPATERVQDSEDGIVRIALDRGLRGCLEHTARICCKSTMLKTLGTTARS